MFKYLIRVFRNILPRGMRNRVSLIPDYIRSLGLINGLETYLHVSLKSHGLIKVSIRKIRHPIFMRANSSDAKIFEEIFIYKSYEIPMAHTPPELIIDGGANVGYASIFFANKYPEAKIIAIEPERLNYKILEKNIRLYHNISAIEAGIWNKEVFLEIKNPGARSSDFQVSETDHSSIRGITLESIRKNARREFIDILKLDIEGAENHVFANPEGWLDYVNILIVELHGDSKTFNEAIKEYKYYDYSMGDIRIFQMKSPKRNLT